MKMEIRRSGLAAFRALLVTVRVTRLSGLAEGLDYLGTNTRTQKPRTQNSEPHAAMYVCRYIVGSMYSTKVYLTVIRWASDAEIPCKSSLKFTPRLTMASSYWTNLVIC